MTNLMSSLIHSWHFYDDERSDKRINCCLCCNHNPICSTKGNWQSKSGCDTYQLALNYQLASIKMRLNCCSRDEELLVRLSVTNRERIKSKKDNSLHRK